MSTLVAKIAVFTFTRYRKNINLRNAARAIATDFAYLKQKAIAERVHYKIVLNTENNNYKIIKAASHAIPSEYDETTAIVKSFSAFSNNIEISSNSVTTYPQSQVILWPCGMVLRRFEQGDWL
jgi:hypothetical protein